MPSQRNMLLADRWERLRKLADGTRTLESLALGLGITYAAMRKMASKDPTLDIQRAVRRDAGEDRKPRKRRLQCETPDLTGGRVEPCGVCATCERNDEKEASVPVERCACGLALPCHACIMPVQDYARSGVSNGCDRS